MGEFDVPFHLKRVDFYALMKRRKYTEAYYLLIENPDIIRNMRVREVAQHYLKFRKVIPTREIRDLASIILREATGKSNYAVIG